MIANFGHFSSSYFEWLAHLLDLQIHDIISFEIGKLIDGGATHCKASKYQRIFTAH